jgi:hypothetical protein
MDRLSELGRRHRRLRAELAAIRPELAREIRAAHAAGIAQVDIVHMTGYTRDGVRRICAAAGEELVDAGERVA